MRTLSSNILVVATTLSLGATVFARNECEGLQWRGGLALSSGFDTDPLAAAAIDHDGDGSPSLFVAGVGGAGGTAFEGLVRLVDGRWEPFGPSFTGSAMSILRVDLDGDGSKSLVVFGSLQLLPAVAGAPRYSMLEWNGSGWTPRGALVSVRDAVALDDDGDGVETLFIATRVPGGTGYPAVMRWSAGNWVDASAGATLGLNSMQADGAVLGAHDSDGDGRQELFATVTVTQSGVPLAVNMARWNGSAWLAADGEAPPIVLDGRVYSMCESDVDGDGAAELVAAGWLPSATPVGSAPQVVAFDGGAWSAVGSGFLTGTSSFMNATIYRVGSVAVAGMSGAELYATGRFTQVGGQAADNIARWNGSAWVPVGSGLPGAGKGANCALVGLDLDADGGQELVGVGSFVVAANGVLNRAASWDGRSWGPVGERAPTLGLDGRVSQSVVFDHDGDGHASIIAGGRFNMAGQIEASQLAAFDGASWQAIANPWIFGVDALLVADADGDGAAELYGSGTTGELVANTYFARTIARYTHAKSGGLWEQVGGDFNASVASMIAFDHDGDGVDSLHAGGGFTVAGSGNAGVVRWTGAAWSVVGMVAAQRTVNTMIAFDDDGDGVESLVIGVGYYNPDTMFQRALKWSGSAWTNFGSMTSGHLLALQRIDHDGDGQASLFGLGHYRVGTNSIGHAQRFEGGVWSQYGPTSTDFLRPQAGAGLLLFDQDSDGIASLYLHTTDPFNGSSGALHRLDEAGWNMLASGLGGGAVQAHLADLESDGASSVYLVGGMIARAGVAGTGIAVLDACGGSCPADLDGDGAIDATDLARLLLAWGGCASQSCVADIDGSGAVDAADLAQLVQSWGACP